MGMFEWYDKHFREITLDPVNKPDTKVKTYTNTAIISTSDPTVLRRLQRRLKNPHVIAVTQSEKQIGLQSVKSVTVKVSFAELQ